MRPSLSTGSAIPVDPAVSLRQQAEGIEALLASLEWGGSREAAKALGIKEQAVKNRLSNLYEALSVTDRLQATVTLWPLIADRVIVRNRAGMVVA